VKDRIYNPAVRLTDEEEQIDVSTFFGLFNLASMYVRETDNEILLYASANPVVRIARIKLVEIKQP